MVKKVHHLVFLLSIQFTPESNNKSHYMLPFRGRPSPPPILQSEHGFENYSNFRENENKNLQHLIVSKHRTTRAEGKYRKRGWKMGKTSDVLFRKILPIHSCSDG